MKKGDVRKIEEEYFKACKEMGDLQREMDQPRRLFYSGKLGLDEYMFYRNKERKLKGKVIYWGKKLEQAKHGKIKTNRGR